MFKSIVAGLWGGDGVIPPGSPSTLHEPYPAHGAAWYFDASRQLGREFSHFRRSLHLPRVFRESRTALWRPRSSPNVAPLIKPLHWVLCVVEDGCGRLPDPRSATYLKILYKQGNV
ncbi:MAG: hypothetical protein ACO2PM_13290 [Pyrobaculum sp.]